MKSSGIILAGGKSSRMKFNKAFARITSQTAIEIIIKKFQAFFCETIIISNDPEEYLHLGLPVFTDVYPRQGPVNGIHSALYYASNESIFCWDAICLLLKCRWLNICCKSWGV